MPSTRLSSTGHALGRMLVPSDLGLRSAAEGDDTNIGLSIGPDAVGVLSRIWRADLDRRRSLSTSAYSVAGALLPLGQVQEIAQRTEAARRGAVSGKHEVVAVRDMIHMFTVMDERHGGQHGRSSLVQYLMSDVASLRRGRFRTEDDRAAMLSAAASGVHLAGWKAYDAGEQGLAQRYYLQSLALARESGVTGHEAFVMRTMSQQGMKLNRPEHCLALAEVAMRKVRGRVDTRTEALFEVTRAHALAGAGRRRGAVQAVQRAQDFLMADQGDEVPFWALSWGPVEATVHSHTAKVFDKLRDQRRAAEEYAAAAAGRSASTYARIFALDLVVQAKMQHAQGHIEQACATWGRALDSMERVQSVRTRKAVVEMRRSLASVRARNIRPAQELDERAAAFLAA